MNKVLHYALMLSTHHIVPAAETPYEIISSPSMKILQLDEAHIKTWGLVSTAIHSDHLRHFNKHISESLINKVALKEKWAENGSKFVDAHTLLESIIALEGTETRALMIATLIHKGAHTRSTYTVARPEFNYYVDHYPPIYYAMIKGNVKAFEALWQADHEVPLDTIMTLWLPEQEIKEEDFVMLEEESSSESLDAVLQEYYTPTSTRRKCGTSLTDDDFVIVDSTEEKAAQKKDIRDFLLLLKDLAENPKNYPKGAPVKILEGRSFTLPKSYVIQDMINITEVKPAEKSLLLSSLSSLSSFFFGSRIL